MPSKARMKQVKVVVKMMTFRKKPVVMKTIKVKSKILIFNKFKIHKTKAARLIHGHHNIAVYLRYRVSLVLVTRIHLINKFLLYRQKEIFSKKIIQSLFQLKFSLSKFLKRNMNQQNLTWNHNWNNLHFKKKTVSLNQTTRN